LQYRHQVQEIALAKKLTILILVDWFAPGFRAGGPIQSTVNIAFALKDKYTIKVLTTDTDFGEENPYPGIPANQWTQEMDEEIKIYYAQKKGLNSRQIRNLIAESQADFVYLNHLFSPLFVVYPLWLKWTGKIKGKIVICPRGALTQSALSVKRFKKIPLLILLRMTGIAKRVRFHATNEVEKTAIEERFPNSEVIVANNLPSTRQLPFTDLEKKPGFLKAIFIARIHPIKNLAFLLDLLKHVKQSIMLTIVGPLEEKDYWEECEKLISGLPQNIKANYQGAIPPHELPAQLHQHHLYILPTSGENFGHSIFEAFLAGRQVLISDQTPWLNLYEQNIGWDLPLNEMFGFVNAIETAAAWNQHDFTAHASASWQFAKNFIAHDSVSSQYQKLFS